MDFFWHRKRPHYMHQNISTNYHLCSFLKTSGFTSVSLHATTGLQRRDQRVGLIAGRHGRLQVPAAATLGQRRGCSFFLFLFSRQRRAGFLCERRRRRRWRMEEEAEGGNILHDNTYICLPFCSLSYRGLSLWQSAVVVTGG